MSEPRATREPVVPGPGEGPARLGPPVGAAVLAAWREPPPAPRRRVIRVGQSGLPLEQRIAELTPAQRERACTWRIAVQGGSGRPSSCTRPEDEDLDGAERWRLEDPNTVEEAQGRTGGRFKPPERIQFVVTQAQCLDETVVLAECTVTVAEYERCMAALAVAPCRAWLAPVCEPVAQCTGKITHRARPAPPFEHSVIPAPRKP